MTEDKIRQLMEEVRSGAVDVDAALQRLRHMPSAKDINAIAESKLLGIILRFTNPDRKSR